MEQIHQAKQTARVLIGEARSRRQPGLALGDVP